MTDSTEAVVLIGTRKGLWIARSSANRTSWAVDGPKFLMEDVTSVGVDARHTPRPRLFAGTTSWVYGTRVVHSDDLGDTWEAVPEDAIRFPERTGTTLAKVWQITPGTEPDEVWAGTEPSAVFRSTDGGVTFELNDGLWDHPHRESWAPGGGGQAVHTILPHPDDPADVLVAMSTGGCYRTTDGGASWRPHSQGIRADFMPDGKKYPEYGQCVHKVARDPSDPERLYAQNHGGVFRHQGRRRALGLDRARSAGHVRLPDPRRPASAGHRVRVSPGGRCRAVPARRRDVGVALPRLTATPGTRSPTGFPSTGMYSAVMRDAACRRRQRPNRRLLRHQVRHGVRRPTTAATASPTIATNLPDVLSVKAVAV